MYEPLATPLSDHMTADLPLVADFTAIDGTTYHRLELIVKRKHGSASIYCLERDWQQTTAAHLAYQMTLNESLIDQVNILAERSERFGRELERLHAQANTSASDRDIGQLALLDTVKRFGEANKQLQNERDSFRAAVDELRRELSGLKVPFTPEVNAIEPLNLDEALDLTPDPADDLPRPEHIPLRLLANDPHATIPCRYGCGVMFVANSGRGAHEKKVHGAVWQGEPLPIASGPWRCESCKSDTFAESVSHPGICLRCANRAELSSLNGIAA